MFHANLMTPTAFKFQLKSPSMDALKKRPQLPSVCQSKTSLLALTPKVSPLTSRPELIAGTNHSQWTMIILAVTLTGTSNQIAACTTLNISSLLPAAPAFKVMPSDPIDQDVDGILPDPDQR